MKSDRQQRRRGQKMDLESRKAVCIHVKFDDLFEGFRRVGVHSGDLVYCHSSLSKFGYVEGAAETVVDALLAAVGPSGTLAAPAGTYSLGSAGNPVFDVRNSPSELGAISEAIRRRSSDRSHHLLDSVSALGPMARELTSTHSPSNCGQESPFQKLIKGGAQILLLGVSHNNNTTFEAVEEELAPEYVAFAEVPGARIIDENGVERPLPTLRHDFTCPYDFNRMNSALIKGGAQTEIVIGEAIVRRVSAEKLYALTKAAILAKPYALRLLPGEQEMREIPTSIHDLGR